MCMIDDADDMVVLLSDSDVVARREHQCSECRGVIAKGETYKRESFIHEGFNQHKTCRRCLAARQWLIDECSGFVYGAVLEDLAEHFNDGI